MAAGISEVITSHKSTEPERLRVFVIQIILDFAFLIEYNKI